MKNGTNDAPEAVTDTTPTIRAELGSGSRRSRAEAGPLVRFQTDLFEHGRQRAVQAGALETKPADLEALCEHAHAAARDAHRPKYDPDANPNDALREERYREAKRRRGSVAESREHGEVSIREKEEQLARTSAPGAAPQIPVLVACGAVLILALTVAPTLRDFLFDGLGDDVLAWVLSLGAALGFGLFLAWSTLGAASGGSWKTLGDGRPASSGRKAVVGAAVVALGLGAWRIGGAEGIAELVTAVALTALEIGVVLVLDWYAEAHRGHVDIWRACHEKRASAEAAVAAAQTELARRQEELRRIDEHMNDHVEYVEDRVFRNLAIDELSRAATTAVTDGYNDGLAVNRGRRMGVRS